VDVEWKEAETKPWIFIAIGTGLRIRNAPPHGVAAVKLWGKLIGMTTKIEKEGIVLRGNGMTHPDTEWVVRMPKFYADRLVKVFNVTEADARAFLDSVKGKASLTDVYSTPDRVDLFLRLNEAILTKIRDEGQPTINELAESTIAPSWPEVIEYCRLNPGVEEETRQSPLEAQEVVPI